MESATAIKDALNNTYNQAKDYVMSGNESKSSEEDVTSSEQKHDKNWTGHATQATGEERIVPSFNDASSGEESRKSTE